MPGIIDFWNELREECHALVDRIDSMERVRFVRVVEQTPIELMCERLLTELRELRAKVEYLVLERRGEFSEDPQAEFAGQVDVAATASDAMDRGAERQKAAGR